MKVQQRFDKLAEWTSKSLGSPVSFGIASAMVVLWLLSGPFMQFNEAWNFWANTTTTIATFLMVFLLQNSSNRNSEELHKLVRDMRDANQKVLARLDTIEDMVED